MFSARVGLLSWAAVRDVVALESRLSDGLLPQTVPNFERHMGEVPTSSHELFMCCVTGFAR